MQRLCKQQAPSSFWQAAGKQINVRRQAIGPLRAPLRRCSCGRALLLGQRVQSASPPQPDYLRASLAHASSTSRLPLHLSVRSRGSSGPRRRATTMMAVAAPKVLMRPPGERQFQWVDMWEAYVSDGGCDWGRAGRMFMWQHVFFSYSRAMTGASERWFQYRLFSQPDARRRDCDWLLGSGVALTGDPCEAHRGSLRWPAHSLTLPHLQCV
jgi:hypothetical protein